MKKFIKKITHTAKSAVTCVKTAAVNSLSAVLAFNRRAVCSNAGEGYIDTAVKVLIAVVLGALVLAGLCYPERYGHAHGNPEDHGNVQLQWLMHWAQAILFCGGLIYAAVDDLRTRTVSNIVCIVIALAGLITISPASLLGALLAMLPFYLCAGFGLMGGGDWRLAAAVGFVLGVGRVLTGFLFMSVALLLASLVMRAFPALRQSAAKKQPLVPYFAVAFIPAYFL